MEDDWEDVGDTGAASAARLGTNFTYLQPPPLPSDLSLDIEIDAPLEKGAPATARQQRRSAADVEAELQWRRGAVLCSLASLRARNAVANSDALHKTVRSLMPTALIAPATILSRDGSVPAPARLPALRKLLDFFRQRLVPVGAPREWTCKPGEALVGTQLVAAAKRGWLNVAVLSERVVDGWQPPAGRPAEDRTIRTFAAAEPGFGHLSPCDFTRAMTCDMDSLADAIARGARESVAVPVHPVGVVLAAAALLRALGCHCRLVQAVDLPPNSASVHASIVAARAGVRVERRRRRRLREKAQSRGTASAAASASAGGSQQPSSVHARRSAGSTDVEREDDEMGGEAAAGAPRQPALSRGLYRELSLKELRSQAMAACCGLWLEVFCVNDGLPPVIESSSSNANDDAAAASPRSVGGGVGRWVAVDVLRQLIDEPQAVDASRPRSHALVLAVSISAEGLVRDVTRTYVTQWSAALAARARQSFLGHAFLPTATKAVSHGMLLLQRSRRVVAGVGALRQAAAAVTAAAAAAPRATLRAIGDDDALASGVALSLVGTADSRESRGAGGSSGGRDGKIQDATRKRRRAASAAESSVGMPPPPLSAKRRPHDTRVAASAATAQVSQVEITIDDDDEFRDEILSAEGQGAASSASSGAGVKKCDGGLEAAVNDVSILSSTTVAPVSSSSTGCAASTQAQDMDAASARLAAALVAEDVEAAALAGQAVLQSFSSGGDGSTAAAAAAAAAAEAHSLVTFPEEWGWLGFTLRAASVVEPGLGSAVFPTEERKLGAAGFSDAGRTTTVARVSRALTALHDLGSSRAAPGMGKSATGSSSGGSGDVSSGGEGAHAAAVAAAAASEPLPSSVSGFKASLAYVLASGLRADEALPPTARRVAVFKGQDVYARSDVRPCLSAEAWMRKYVRVVRPGEVCRPVRTRAARLLPERGRGTGGGVKSTRGASSAGRGRSRMRDDDNEVDSDDVDGDDDDRDVDSEDRRGGIGGRARGSVRSDRLAASAAAAASTLPPPVPLFGEWQTEPYRPAPHVPGSRLPVSERGSFEMWDGNAAFLPAGIVYISAAESAHISAPSLKQRLWAARIACEEVLVGFQPGRGFPVFDGLIIAAADAPAVREIMAHGEQAAALEHIGKRREAVLARWVLLTRRLLVKARIARVFVGAAGDRSAGVGRPGSSSVSQAAARAAGGSDELLLSSAANEATAAAAAAAVAAAAAAATEHIADRRIALPLRAAASAATVDADSAVALESMAANDEGEDLSRLGEDEDLFSSTVAEAACADAEATVAAAVSADAPPARRRKVFCGDEDDDA